MLDSDLMRTFVAVADAGSFTHGAVQVSRTQSAVSMQIKRLEDLVGEPLFERGSRGVALTRKGQDLIVRARRIVSLIDETAASLRSVPLDGPVRIGIPEEYGDPVLADALALFTKRHPGVEVTVRFAHTLSQLSALYSGELDLAVVFEWQSFSDGEMLRSDPTVWATSQTRAFPDGSPVPVALYNTTGWCRDFALKSLERDGIDYRIAYMSDTSGGLRLAATSGLAIAPITRSRIPEGCRELGPADGFSPIDAARVVLLRNPNTGGAAIDSMAQAIREAFGATR